MITSNENLWSRRRLALIIGNENYQSNNKSRRSINNANDLKASLEKLQFTVTIHLDTPQEMMDKIADFAKKIKDGDLILFYFSGNSYQVNTTNYLLPTRDEKIETEVDVESFGCKADKVLERLTRNNKSYVTIFILDCNFPYILKSDPGVER